MTDTATETKDLSEYVNKRVIVTRNLSEPDAEGNGAVEVEGTVQAFSPGMGLLLKAKGKVNFDLIPEGEIEDVRLVVDTGNKLKRTKLQLVKEGAARRHLLERHGFTLSEVNAMTEDEAMNVHSEIDHEQQDLGHVHVEKKDEDDSTEDGDSEE